MRQWEKHWEFSNRGNKPLQYLLGETEVTHKNPSLDQCSATVFHPRHTIIFQRHDGTPQNFASRNGDTKSYMTMNVNLHINTCPTRVQAYENKILHMLDKTIDDEPESVCVCVCVCVGVCITNFNYKR
jgi:hypothetical protein